jgi:predicted nucleotide-binding protein
MPVRDLSSFPSTATAEDVLAFPLPRLGEILLMHLYSWRGEGKVWQLGGLNRQYFVDVMEGHEKGLGTPRRNQPEYGVKQPEVTLRMQEAWSWLENHLFLMRAPGQPSADWYLITTEAEKILPRAELHEQLERMGPDRVRSELGKEHPRIGVIGGGREQLDWAWEWLRMKEEQKTAGGVKITPPTERQELSRKVFIVHGHDDGAREAVARFLERLGLQPVILHEQANRGKTVIEKFEMHRDVGFAVVLMTPDDEGCEKGGTPRPRARQNVVLELGYFVGVLGRDRVCALRRGDVEIPSDFTGVVYVHFDDGGGWRQALAKELEAAGYEIDWNKIMGTRS